MPTSPRPVGALSWDDICARFRPDDTLYEVYVLRELWSPATNTIEDVLECEDAAFFATLREAERWQAASLQGAPARVAEHGRVERRTSEVARILIIRELSGRLDYEHDNRFAYRRRVARVPEKVLQAAA